jgi:predicted DCC family thiol-disulfide oxidoreductase YuxK
MAVGAILAIAGIFRLLGYQFRYDERGILHMVIGGLGLVAAPVLLVGRWSRTMALLVAASLLLVVPRGQFPFLIGLSLLVLTQLFVPIAPWGSLDARGRVDPGGGFRFPTWLRACVLLLLLCHHLDVFALSYGTPFSRIPFFWPRAALLVGLAVPRVRVVCLLVLLLLDALVALPSVLFYGGTLVFSLPLHLLAFDRRWVAPLRDKGPDRIFYDGTCGFCHGWVRFLLAEDGEESLRFSPLQGKTFLEAIPERERSALPDSIVLVTPSGDVLVRSAAALRLLARIGGLWRVLGAPLRLVPGPVRDLVYDAVARVRKKIARPPAEACPVVPEHLRRRFDP